MTYPVEFRRKVLSIKERDQLSDRETAERFGIGLASLTRWKKRLEPHRTRNKPATKINMAALAKDVELYPDGYQYERAARLGVSQRGIGYALQRLKLSYKKNTIASSSRRRSPAAFSDPAGGSSKSR